MIVTTFLMILIMLLVWRSHWILVLIFTILSLVVECTYLSAVLLKVNQGGWVPLVIAATFFVIMYVWHYGTVKRYEVEMHSKVSMAWILSLEPSLGLVRVPGIGLVYTELAVGVPHIFSHLITNLPAMHSVVSFVCVKYLPVYTVPQEERFLVKRIGPKNFHMFRCVARYGYRDLHQKDDDFENRLFESLLLFVRLESMMEGGSSSDSDIEPQRISTEREQSSTMALAGRGSLLTENNRNMIFSLNDHPTAMSSSPILSDDSNSIIPVKYSPVLLQARRQQHAGDMDMELELELEFLKSCRDAGVVHILGNTIVRAGRDANLIKTISIDYIYAFLKRICRENSAIFHVPHESLLNVGQIFYV
ncbi:potassium transporter [Macleaya cordata]|uniref:Potassium transporter n=1 Tax=Macleaya cordata TaxID=56857 RepID=A0A200Q869_MACCD|nr:potassium transporter [Macleaya cordata]